MMRSAQAALDVTGRRLVATDAAGGTRWSTPLAAALLDGLGSEGAAAIAVQIGRMIQTIVASADKPDRTSARVTISDRQIEITHHGRGLGSDYLFRPAQLRQGMEAAALQTGPGHHRTRGGKGTGRKR